MDWQEFSVACAWYEALSIVHAMAMLSLLEANLVLLPREITDGSERKVSEGLVFYFVLCFLKYVHMTTIRSSCGLQILFKPPKRQWAH